MDDHNITYEEHELHGTTFYAFRFATMDLEFTKHMIEQAKTISSNTSVPCLHKCSSRDVQLSTEDYSETYVKMDYCVYDCRIVMPEEAGVAFKLATGATLKEKQE